MFFDGETGESTLKIDLHLRFGLSIVLIMFGYELVKRFRSTGYENWEDWRE